MKCAPFNHLPQFKEDYPEHNVKAHESARVTLRNGKSKLVFVAGLLGLSKFRFQKQLVVGDKVDVNGNLVSYNDSSFPNAGGYQQVIPIRDIVRYRVWEQL